MSYRYFVLFTDTVGFSLSANLSSIVIVDGFYALSFWEVFELSAIKGIVITLSSMNYVGPGII